MISCTHHWLIEPANGHNKLTGTCKKCGADRDFLASSEDNKWLADVPIIVKSLDELIEKELEQEEEEW
jgi:hypothetical protein